MGNKCFDIMDTQEWKHMFNELETTYRNDTSNSKATHSLVIFIRKVRVVLNGCYNYFDLPLEAIIAVPEYSHGEMACGRRLMHADTPINDGAALAIAAPNESRSLADAAIPAAGLLLVGF